MEMRELYRGEVLKALPADADEGVRREVGDEEVRAVLRCEPTERWMVVGGRAIAGVAVLILAGSILWLVRVGTPEALLAALIPAAFIAGIAFALRRPFVDASGWVVLTRTRLVAGTLDGPRAWGLAEIRAARAIASTDRSVGVGFDGRVTRRQMAIVRVDIGKRARLAATTNLPAAREFVDEHLSPALGARAA